MDTVLIPFPSPFFEFADTVSIEISNADSVGVKLCEAGTQTHDLPTWHVSL